MSTLRLPGLLLLALLLPATSAAAQTQTFSTPYSQAELDRMLAPVALYPDSVLAQLLIAATYPLDVMEAAHWSREHPGLEGDAAVDAVADQDWDPGVKAMVAFPDVIDRMDRHIDWTTHLGDAFLQQEGQVMATIQSLREHALEEGHLKSNDTVRVYREPEIIIIEPVYPRVVYVPYYDPWIVYGHWWHPHHPPYYWTAPHHYHRTSVFYWGSGINFSFGFFYSNFDWHHRHVVVHKHYRDHDYYRKHRPHHYRAGKPFYKHADYDKHYRHWRPDHRQRVHVDKRHIDHKRHQLGGGYHDRPRYDRDPGRHEAGRYNNRDHQGGKRSSRADDVRDQLRSFKYGPDNRANRPERFAVGDRRNDHERRSDRPPTERARPQGNERDRAAVERFRTNLERHQYQAEDIRARRQPDGQANRAAAFQRERSVNNERRLNDARVRELRQSLGNNRPAVPRPGERSLQHGQEGGRDDGRVNANNRPRPSFDNHAALNQRQARESQIQRHGSGARRDMDRAPRQAPRQALGNAGHNRQQAAGRAMDNRHSYYGGSARSSHRPADRPRFAGPERRGNGGGGRDRDFSVAGKNGQRH